MSDTAPKRRLHSNVKREWRSRRQRNKIQKMGVLEATNTDEEINLNQDEESVVNNYVNQHSSSRYVSSERETEIESDFEDPTHCFNGNYDSQHGADEDIDTEYFTNQINNEDRNKTTPLYDGSPISVYDACVHLIRLTHLLNLNKNRLQMLLKELRVFFPSDCRLPKTVFMLFKLTDNDDRPQVSVRCVNCGEVLMKSDQSKCSNTCNSNGKYRSYSQVAELAIMNVQREIKQVAERHINLINEYPRKAAHLCPPDYITNKSVWPVQATIAEIPTPIRDCKSAVMLFGAWLARTKPPRDHLLLPIITQLELLMRSEIILKQNDGNVFLMLTLCKHFILGSSLSYNVRIQQAIFDLPARAHFLNIVQYNGYDGCGDCCIKNFINILMQRPQRIRKPNSRYDPNFYVLASFPKKNKHTIIPKHQVTIDVIDTQNGTVRSSGFVQPVRIIAEGSRSKCQERASQFSRDTGSEEVDVRPDNDDEDELVDNNHIYTTQNFYNNESSQYSSITTSWSNDSSPKPLLIDEYLSVQQNNQENSCVHSNVVDEMSDICEEDNDEEYIPILKKKSTQKKRKRTLRSKQSTSNSVATVEITNLQKEFLLHQFKVENRLKALEKTFRILKNRKILRENKNLSNIVNSAFSSRPSPPTEPEFVLGVDVSNFPFGFNEHTRFIRQIFRAAGYASNPNAVLCDEEKVTELKDVMKKRDKTLQDDEEALAEAWQVVKESVRQLKHDHKRNEIFKTIRTSTTNTNTSNTSPFKDTENNSINIAPN
ncbi:unnamed protein product [Rotaria sp. Silwood1]|nr:unnamed protein product [Rotaria sp. Silwood1]CAF3570493.1 unnamed protein product [Rotaria sp. Silwood1]CAF3720850.1 unnamed protein product [Rotaria sp. Silwood1]CAF4568720.1 unnamed protein product [Rotaria sp. Silwood1]